MKKLLVLLIMFLPPMSARASSIVNNAGTPGPEDSISFVINSLDSLGNPVAADTFYLLVIGPRGDSVFSEKGTNNALARVDSALMGGYTAHIFKAQVSDIDGPGAVGKYTCQMVARKNSPLHRCVTVGEFQITSSELSDALDSSGMAARGGIFTTAQRDSILSALADAVLGNKVWNRPYTSSFGTGSMGDSLNNKSSNEIYAVANDSLRIYRQAGRAVHDSATTQSNLVAAVWNEDTTGNGLANSFGLMAQKSGSGASNSWSAAQRDSVLASVGDSHMANKIWKADTAGRVATAGWFGRFLKISGDSSIWVKPIDLWNQPFNSGFLSGSIGDSLRRPSYVGNLHSVAGNSAAAGNFRSMLDGTGGSALSLGLLNVGGANGSAGSFRVTNTTGPAAAFNGQSGWDIDADLYGSVDTVLKGSGGSNGGNDSTSIARWVWNTPHVNHVTDGTFGRYLDVEVSSLAAGSGAWSFTVVATDSTSNQAVPNAFVSIRNLEQTALVAVGTTNTFGRAWFNLNSGRYLAIIITPGYIFPAYDTISVVGPGADTVRGYQFNPGVPASPALCRIYGYVFGVSGTPERDIQVSALLPKGVSRTGDFVVSPLAVSAQSDSAGYFFLDLIPSDSLKPSGSPYEISISRPDGTILRKRITVPSQSSWRLTW